MLALPRRQRLWPVIQQLSRAAGFADEDTAEQRLDKLEALLARAGDERRGTADRRPARPRRHRPLRRDSS